MTSDYSPLSDGDLATLAVSGNDAAFTEIFRRHRSHVYRLIVGNVVDAGFKSGIYVKVNQQGDLVDTGWRVGPNVKVVGGNAEFTAFKDEIDLSFTSSLTPGY